MAEIANMGVMLATLVTAGTGATGTTAVATIGTEIIGPAARLGALLLPLVAGVATVARRLAVPDPALRAAKRFLRLTVAGAGKDRRSMERRTSLFGLFSSKQSLLRFKLFLLNVRVESTEQYWFMSSPPVIPL